ncbi:MAG: TonB-dependent receptor, partial [Nitrospinaceae bacterium]|nr:TonB-dependent receptor [Nitrospinaceae bacterium]NIR53306.1 TonB-dependent receptor [Nitrospinaceae bacterium]NIS83704.1 TonB-dependent receptor [Nitrospinaceae bacterium]NIU42828.1 TonB-dependent receptor [Nitrospinaceae bacterium]NIU94899.1 TonB-dependent receptor [Nitrospinaceae bacterium]
MSVINKIRNPLKELQVPFVLLLWILLSGFSKNIPEGSEVFAGNMPEDLTKLSLEQLMDIKVTSVSKKPEKAAQAAAAVFVITQEDIRRSGATHIAEVLRMVPGVEVARVDSNKWAVTIRGFNDLFARKLLVLIDGRSVYTGMFSGTFWDTQDTALEDIERIEVIRGPGATVWGVNAVNGVINIITKNAGKTQGALVSGGGGNLDQGFTTMRYGSKMGDQAHYRVYGKWFERDSFEDPNGVDSNDDWNALRGGFRVDWEVNDSDQLTFQGDVYDGNSNSRRFTVLAPGVSTIDLQKEDVRGGNVLARWTRKFSDQSDMKAQFFYNNEYRQGPVFGQNIHMFDLDIQHRLPIGERHDLVWGVDGRLMTDELKGSFALSFNPLSDTNYFVNGFIQDQITLIPDQIKFTVGTKLGYNSFSGWEVQPSGRLLWTPNDRHSLWASASRAVRTPSRFEDSSILNFNTAPGPVTFQVNGNPDLKSENLLAYELGYRVKATDKLFLDIATFFNVYNDLLTSEPVSVFPPVISSQSQNLMKGESWGVEAAATWDAFDFWRIKAAFSWFELDLFLEPGSQSFRSTLRNGNSPQFQANLRSRLDLPGGWEFDTAFNYV